MDTRKQPQGTSKKDAMSSFFHDIIELCKDEEASRLRYTISIYDLGQYLKDLDDKTTTFMSVEDISKAHDIYDACISSLSGDVRFAFAKSFGTALHMTCLPYPGVSRLLRSSDHMAFLFMITIRDMIHHRKDEVIPFKSVAGKSITMKQEIMLSLDAFERHVNDVSNMDTIIALFKEFYTERFNDSLKLLCMNNGLFYDMAFLEPEAALQCYHEIQESSFLRSPDNPSSDMTMRGMVCMQSRSLDSWKKNMEKIMLYHDDDILAFIYHLNGSMESIPFDLIVDACVPREPDAKDYDTVIRYINVFNDGVSGGRIRINVNILAIMLEAAIISQEANSVAYIYVSLLSFLFHYHKETVGRSLTDTNPFLIRSADFDSELLEYITTMPYEFAKEVFISRIKNINNRAVNHNV